MRAVQKKGNKIRVDRAQRLTPMSKPARAALAEGLAPRFWPVERLAAIARRHGARVLLDAAQLAAQQQQTAHVDAVQAATSANAIRQTLQEQLDEFKRLELALAALRNPH